MYRLVGVLAVVHPPPLAIEGAGIVAEALVKKYVGISVEREQHGCSGQHPAGDN